MRYLVVVTQVDVNEEYERVLHMYLTQIEKDVPIYRRKVEEHYPKGSIKIKTFTERELIEKLGLEYL